MGRGRRLDAHGARVYLTLHLACEVANLYPTENTFGGDPELPRRSSGGCTACERLGERRVRPSSKEERLVRGRLIKRLWSDALIWMQNKEKAPLQLIVRAPPQGCL